MIQLHVLTTACVTSQEMVYTLMEDERFEGEHSRVGDSSSSLSRTAKTLIRR